MMGRLHNLTAFRSEGMRRRRGCLLILHSWSPQATANGRTADDQWFSALAFDFICLGEEIPSARGFEIPLL